MPETRTASTSRSRVILLIVLLFLAVLLAAAGFVWSRDTAVGDNGTEGASAPESLAEAPADGAVGAPTVEAQQATAAPPQAPTAIATSKPTEVPLPSFTNSLDATFAREAEAWNVPLRLVDEDNTGLWQFEPGTFLHPIAMAFAGDVAYLLDAGRVLSIHTASPQAPSRLLSPGDQVSGIRVIEPVDLAVTGDQLFVLDRAGDVYRYDRSSGSWEQDRYDRPSAVSSGHYFVALDAPEVATDDSLSSPARTLLETNYKFVLRYGGERVSLWNLPEGRSVDVGVNADDVFVLQREMSGAGGFVLKFRDTRSIPEFEPAFDIDRPRQITATEAGVHVLDKEGRRLLTLDRATGALRALYQLPQEDVVSTLAWDDQGRLLLAGRDRLYWVDQPDKVASIAGSSTLRDMQPHDPAVLQSLIDFSVPIGGTNITYRDFQMPGAPRHYRLGVNEGLDFYWQPGTKVIAAADGTVVRADLDYVGPTALELATWWNETQELGYTTSERLDDYLGRQVWIDHGQGIITRYGHLRAIEPGIATGVEVSRGQVIGEVGNSGSPASLESESSDAHLHFELWLGDNHLGQYLRPIEIREWIERIFSD